MTLELKLLDICVPSMTLESLWLDICLTSMTLDLQRINEPELVYSRLDNSKGVYLFVGSMLWHQTVLRFSNQAFKNNSLKRRLHSHPITITYKSRENIN